MILRPYSDEDFAAVLELMNAHQLAAFGEADANEEEFRSWLTAPSVDVERDIRLADPTREEPPRWWCDVKVAPDQPAGVLVPLIVDWLDERAAVGSLRVWSANDDARIVGAFAALGFEPVRHSYRMEIDLAGDERLPAWPEGIALRAYADGDARLVYDAVIEVWRDTNDPNDETFEEWSHWTTGAPGFDPALWFLAFGGDELAGFSLCKQDTVDASAGYVANLGVRRSWRRQGLGEALLLHSFRAFRERGYTRGTLGVDASSVTGATRLYERAGMSVYRDTVFLERPVGAAS